MTLTQIEYVLAVAKEKSFPGTGQVRFVGQPTFSMQIQKMEEELGVSIFNRSKSPILPIKIGKLIIDRAKVVYSEAMRIPEIIQPQRAIYLTLRKGYLKEGLVSVLKSAIFETLPNELRLS